jgi:hypothetical protein
MPGHEIDDFGRNLFSCAHEIAFIFAIFVINNYDHPAIADISNSLIDSSERHQDPGKPFGAFKRST